jgi:high-affinity iron transporter
MRLPAAALALTLAALAAVAGAGCRDSAADVVPLSVPAPAVESAETDRARAAERLVALFDYVATDYGAAVQGGAVASAAEYEEQLRIVDDMRRLAAGLPAPAPREIEALDAAIRAKAPAAEVAERCGALRRAVVARCNVVIAPAFAPNLSRAAELFKARCAECHGLDGRAETPVARKLTPPPANLLDPERMAGVTPYRAYCAVTYGIEGTAMPANQIPASDRWSLAFYAVALRHGEAPPGQAGPARAPRFGLATLANETDAGLDRLLAESVPDSAARAAEIARLRAAAPFEASVAETPIALARRLVREAEEQASRGNAAEADRLVLDAYLRGVEEVEGVIRARDAALAAEMEAAVGALRASIRGGDAGSLEGRAARVLALLDRFEAEADRSPAGAAVLALAGATLVLREGLEAALIVAAVLAVVRRTGARRAARAVHGGWISALLAGAVTFVLARTLIARLALERELVEGAVSILAAAVLFLTSFWLISKADARRWVSYLKERAAGSIAGGQLLGLASVAFLAVYREAFESVLFFEALAGGETSRLPALAGGAAAGGALLALAVFAIQRLERRLPIGPFFAASGAGLSGLAVVLFGHGIHAIEQTRFLAPRPIAAPTVAWLGVYPDAIGLTAQAALAAAIVLLSALFFLRRPAAPAPEKAPAPAPAPVS